MFSCDRKHLKTLIDEDEYYRRCMKIRLKYYKQTCSHTEHRNRCTQRENMRAVVQNIFTAIPTIGSRMFTRSGIEKFANEE